MDHFVIFAHPNGKVVPLVDTTPMTFNINHNNPPASPLHLQATACRASWSCWWWQRWTLRLKANGHQSFVLTGMLSFCLTDFFFLGSLLSWQCRPTASSPIATAPTQHHHPACEPLLAGGDGGADRQQRVNNNDDNNKWGPCTPPCPRLLLARRGDHGS